MQKKQQSLSMFVKDLVTENCDMDSFPVTQPFHKQRCTYYCKDTANGKRL